MVSTTAAEVDLKDSNRPSVELLYTVIQPIPHSNGLQAIIFVCCTAEAKKKVLFCHYFRCTPVPAILHPARITACTTYTDDRCCYSRKRFLVWNTTIVAIVGLYFKKGLLVRSGK